MSHVYTILVIDNMDSRIFISSLNSCIQITDDRNDLRCNLLQIINRPFFQCFCEDGVIGICKALLEEGKRIPEDVAVAGFDGLDYTGFYQPAITTMAQPVEEIARQSVGILFDMIETKKSQEGKYLPATLKERESTTGGRRTWKQD